MKLKEIKLGKFNILDISIFIIIALFIGIFAFNKLNVQNESGNIVTSNANQSTFSYTILVEGLSESSRDMFRIGDDVYDKVSNVYIGKIANLEITPAKGLIDKNNGEIIESTVPGKIDVKIGVETNGTIKNGEYLANDLIRIMVGNLKQIKTKYVMCMGTILDIEM